MPDRHGFNLLGESVRCIECEAGGPIWRWPERKRRRHARGHLGTARAARTTELRRRRILLAAPLARPDEETKEVPTMAKRRAKNGEPAKQVTIEVLREAGGPLHANEIAKRVIDSGRTRLGGKTPEQTITAMLAVGSKPGGPFTRVDKGTYTLADAAATAASEQAEAAEKPEAKPKPRKRQQETPAA
jgi:HB1, ASXL, restriction endonuclease HTH domain